MLRKTHVWFVCLLVVGVLGFCWSCYPQTYHFPLPMTFNRSNQPLVEIEIEGKNFLVMLDSGSTRQLVLEKDTLGSLKHKTDCGTVSWYNIKGKHYESSCYLLPQIKFGCLSFDKVVANENTVERESDACLAKGKEEITPYVGAIGSPILEKMNILCDFPDSVVIISNDKMQLQKEGYHFEKMIAVPFEKNRLLVIAADTDLGRKKFIIDTGSSLNILKSASRQHSQYTSQILVGGEEMGNITFVFLDLPAQFGDVDGIIGMSFLEKHVLYIDSCHRTLYMEKP